MVARIRLTPVDTAWLRMDTPGNLMMIVGVQIFDRIVDASRLRALLQTHLCVHPQFCARVDIGSTGAWWVSGDVNLDHHLIRIALPGRASTAELQHLIAQLAGQSLDITKPLWQMHLIENYKAHSGAPQTSALIVRIHHCIADGMALIRLLLSMTSPESEGAVEAPLAGSTSRSAAYPEASNSFAEQSIHWATQATVSAINVAGELISRSIKGMRFALEQPQWLMQQAAQIGRDVAEMALMTPDSVSELKGQPCGVKAVAWHAPIPLEQIKALGKAMGCSVNDVLLGCAAGAFRAYLLAHDRTTPLEGAQIRALVPINLRRDDGARGANDLGNQFGLVPVLLPIGEMDPIRRVKTLKRQMMALKEGYMPVMAMVLLGVTGVAPRAVQQSVLGVLARKATAVITNVPGPRAPLYMAGAKLTNMMFWVPQAGNIGVGVSLLSYDGQVQFGLITDKAMCSNPRAIVERFGLALGELQAAINERGLVLEQSTDWTHKSNLSKSSMNEGSLKRAHKTTQTRVIQKSRTAH